MSALTRIRRQVLDGAIRMLSIRRRRLLAWRSLMASDVRSVTVERDGIVWNLSVNDDDVAFYVFVEGGFQRRELQALLEWMRRCHVLSGSRNVIVDVGANIGTTCIPLAREAGCRALAVEPVLQNFRLLKMNVEANGLGDRILLANKAVLRAPGSVSMCLTRGGSGGHFVWQDGLTDTAAAGVAEYEEVTGDALSAIVASAGLGANEIALVWADVQGCEAHAVESGARLWETGVPLWAEVEPLSLLRQGSLESFAALAGVHFDRFIDSRELMRLGEKALPVPITRLESLIQAITPDQGKTDVLFLPPQFLSV